jgi:hypothetical protein|tara:strand:+ start:436 stop:1203 length:768 start_codon:yes stop_codon:yes gene_type:complete
MKLFEVYQGMLESETWVRFDEYLSKEASLTEIDAVNINELLGESKFLIFEAFGLNPSQSGKYFIGGSARLFKNPQLLKVLNELDKSFPLSVGDLDVVVTGEQEWKTLYNNYTNKDSDFMKKLGKIIGEDKIPTIMSRFKKQWDMYDGKIYRPGGTKDGLGLSKKDIEAFTEWRPDLASDKARNVEIRPTSKILEDSVKIGGYYYMSIYDVFDYKQKLGREKEQAIVKLLEKFLDGSQTPQESEILFKNIRNILDK